MRVQPVERNSRWDALCPIGDFALSLTVIDDGRRLKGAATSRDTQAEQAEGLYRLL